MKHVPRNHLMLGALLLAVLAAITAWHFRPLPEPTVGDLYRLYASQPGVRVGYIEDFRVDSTLALDVTTLQALDADGWQWMKEEFGLDPDAGAEARADDPDHASIVVKPLSTTHSPLSTLAIADLATRELCLLQPEGNEQYNAILKHYILNLKQ